MKWVDIKKVLKLIYLPKKQCTIKGKSLKLPCLIHPQKMGQNMLPRRTSFAKILPNSPRSARGNPNHQTGAAEVPVEGFGAAILPKHQVHILGSWAPFSIPAAADRSTGIFKRAANDCAESGICTE